MTKIAVKFAELHNPLFMNGNLGQKLDPKMKTGMTLNYDEDKDRLIVVYKGSVAFIPSANVSSWCPTDPLEAGVEIPKAPIAAVPQPPATPTQNDLLIQQSRQAAMGIKVNAQIEDPTRPREGSTGKPKAISHAQLKTQIAKEMKE